MLIPRACDLCQQALPSEVVQFEIARGTPVRLPRQQWTVAARPAGRQLCVICRPCSEYLTAAIRHLADSLRREGGWSGVEAAAERDTSVAA